MQYGLDRAGELFGLGLVALHHGHGHHALGEVGVDLEHLPGLGNAFLVGGVGRVALLPEELAGAQEHPRPQLPAHDVGPLVDEERQVPIGADPLGEEVADDGLRGGPHHVGLLQLLAPRVGHHRELGREPLHVLGLLLEEAHRDEQREVGVLVAGLLEAPVEIGLDLLPDGVAVGLDHHAALDHLGRLGEIRLPDHVLVPLGVVLFPGGDLALVFGHALLSPVGGASFPGPPVEALRDHRGPEVLHRRPGKAMASHERGQPRAWPATSAYASDAGSMAILRGRQARSTARPFGVRPHQPQID